MLPGAMTDGMTAGMTADDVVNGSVQTNSVLVEPGSIFFALPGEVTDGHLFADDAVSRGASVVVAHVPLSEMFGYVGDLRSKTQGRASYSMQFDSYAQVPQNVALEIIAKARGE